MVGLLVGRAEGCLGVDLDEDDVLHLLARRVHSVTVPSPACDDARRVAARGAGSSTGAWSVVLAGDGHEPG